MTDRRFLRWSGPQPDRTQQGESTANAKPGHADLTPVSEEPAQQVRDAWAALLPQPDDYRQDD